MRSDLADRFWAKVERRGPDDCWPWIGYRDRGGYGRIRVKGRSVAAHRIAYELQVGPIPPAPHHHILHRCDNPPCCNGAHLRPGSNAENQSEKIGRGRQRSNPNAGVRNGRSKLTPAQIKTIRTSRESCTKLALKFDVSVTTISKARRGETYVGV